MRKSTFSLVMILSMCGFCIAQYQLAALERAKEIKLLQDDREAVRRLLHDYNLDNSAEYSDEFSLGDESIEVIYSSGTCDEEEDEIWNVPEGRATRIEITRNEDLNAEDLGIDLSKPAKEQVYANEPETFIYHSKANGLAIRVDDDLVDRFILFPSVNSKAKTCKSKAAKEFVSSKSWFGSTKLEDRKVIACYVASATDLSLSLDEISALSPKVVQVSTTATDPEGGVLTYQYSVTAGRVIGKGPKVFWDLTGVASGTYTITAAVDDGCGFCGITMTKTFTIK